MRRRRRTETDTLKKPRFPSDKRVTLRTAGRWLHYLHPLTARRRFRSLHMFGMVIWNDIRRLFLSSPLFPSSLFHEAYRLLRRVPPTRISPVAESSRTVRWKSEFLCQRFTDIGSSVRLTTRYDWNISRRTMDFIRDYTARNVLSVYTSLSAFRNKMLLKLEPLWEQV